MSRGHLRSASSWKTYRLDQTPSLAEVRKIAAGQGFLLRVATPKRVTAKNGAGSTTVRSTRSPYYWLVEKRSGRLATPRLDLAQVWTAVALPRADIRTEGLWLD